MAGSLPLRVLPGPLADLAVLVGRVLIGVVLMAHGWQKIGVNGLDATADSMRRMGVPAPSASAAYAGIVELIGGGLLVLGALTAVVCVLAALDMLGAAFLVHLPNGLFIKTGQPPGWELVGVICAGCLVLAGFGAGRYSVDAVLAKRAAGT